MRVTVFGATGDQGWAQVERLAAHRHSPLAAVRDPSRLPAHATSIRADYRDPASIASAVCGADAVFLTLPSTSFNDASEVAAAADTVAAAMRTEGVPLLVFNTSMYLADAPLGFAAQDARFAIRQALFDSGVPTISIQPVIYLGNLLRAWAFDDIVRDGVIRYPHDAKLAVSWISQEATAELMIAAVMRPHLAGRAFNVGGREAVQGPDLAQRLSPAVGRELRFESLPIDRFVARMAARFAGSSLSPESLTAELSRIYRWYNDAPSQPFRVDMDPVLAELPAAIETIEAWARRQSWSAGGCHSAS